MTNELKAERSQLVWILPTIIGLTTLILWFLSVAQHRTQMHSLVHAGSVQVSQREAFEIWTDYTPIPLEAAGGLNVPIATFASPMYGLLYSYTSNLKRVVLFLGVILLWGYVGWVWDRRRACRDVPVKSRVIATLGVLFGIFIVCISLPMYNVGIIYKAAAVLWAFPICRHFSRYWKGPDPIRTESNGTNS